MDFSTLANGICANTNTAVVASRPGELAVAGSDEFLAEAERVWNEAAEPREADELYAGSTARVALSDAEIAALANKYNLRSMDAEAYDAFLDDLQSMGAISEREKGALGYKGMVTVGYFGADGEVVSAGACIWLAEGNNRAPFSASGRDSGDLTAWLADRLAWKALGITYSTDPAKTEASKKAARQDNEMIQSLAGIISRMTGTPVTAGTGSGRTVGEEETSLIDQLADPGSSFYQDMYQRMRLNLEESEEQKKEQAIIDALDAILEGMRATDGTKRKNVASSMLGLSKQINELDAEDPRRAQLDLLRQRLNQLGIYIDLEGSSGYSQGTETLTQYLIQKETQSTDSSIFDLI